MLINALGATGGFGHRVTSYLWEIEVRLGVIELNKHWILQGHLCLLCKSLFSLFKSGPMASKLGTALPYQLNGFMWKYQVSWLDHFRISLAKVRKCNTGDTWFGNAVSVLWQI